MLCFIVVLRASVIRNRLFPIFMSGFIALAIADTLIARVHIFTTSNANSDWRILAFATIGILFITSQGFTLGYIRKRIRELRSRKMLGLMKTHKTVTLIQYILASIILLIIFQVIVPSQYYNAEIIMSITISYGLSIFLLITLTLKFFSWLKTNRNNVVLCYALSSLLISVNVLLTLIFVNYLLLQQPAIARPHSGLIYPTQLLVSSSIISIINYGFIASSIASFISFWIATSFLLRHYIHKLGKIKYWSLLIIPLLYFVFQFSTPLLTLFSSITQTSPVLASIVFTILFTLSKPIGGILFGIAFISVGRSFPIDSDIRRYFTVASFGVIMLFVSNQAVVFSYFVYPPFGLVTISMLGLSSYLVLLGIYASAISVSEDVSLRKTIKNHTLKESELLGNIGVAQMRKEIETKVLSITRKNRALMTEETGISPSLTDEEAKEYLEKVLIEIKRK